MGKFVLLLIIVFAIGLTIKLFKKDSVRNNPYKNYDKKSIDDLEKYFKGLVDNYYEESSIGLDHTKSRINYYEEELRKIKQIKEKLNKT